MRLYQRPNSPYWWFYFCINGKPYRGSTKRPLSDKAGAKRVMSAEYERLLNEHQFGEKPEITLREAMERTVASVSGSTKRSYDLCMRKFLGVGVFASKWHLKEDMLLSQLSDADLEDHLNSRKEEGLTENSIAVEQRFLKRVHNLMAKRFKTNRDLSFPKVAYHMKTRYLTEQEEWAVLRTLEDERGNPAYDKARDLFIFLIDTGVRLSEALGLDWADVDLHNHTITIYRQKTKVLSLVPITDRVHDILQSRHNQRLPFEAMSRAIRLLRKIIDAECNHNERIVAQRGKATIHTLRDTFASRLVQKNMSLQKVSKLLGHTSMKMTQKYAQLEAADVAAEARALMSA